LEIEPMAFSPCERLGPSIELPPDLRFIPKDCFAGCKALLAVTFAPNSSLRQIQGKAFTGCLLKSICVPSSCVTIHWSCFLSCPGAINVTFESPARLREISGFDGATVRQLEVPDSVARLMVRQGGNRGFVCSFGRDSQLASLDTTGLGLHGFGFMRLSEASLKRIREQKDWLDAHSFTFWL
jgi:hypothetical protein